MNYFTFLKSAIFRIKCTCRIEMLASHNCVLKTRLAQKFLIYTLKTDAKHSRKIVRTEQKLLFFCCYSNFLSNMLRHNLFLLCCVLCTQDQFMLHCKAVNSQNFNVSLQNIVFPYYLIIIQACLLAMFLRWY